MFEQVTAQAGPKGTLLIQNFTLSKQIGAEDYYIILKHKSSSTSTATSQPNLLQMQKGFIFQVITPSDFEHWLVSLQEVLNQEEIPTLSSSSSQNLLQGSGSSSNISLNFSVNPVLSSAASALNSPGSSSSSLTSSGSVGSGSRRSTKSGGIFRNTKRKDGKSNGKKSKAFETLH